MFVKFKFFSKFFVTDLTDSEIADLIEDTIIPDMALSFSNLTSVLDGWTFTSTNEGDISRKIKTNGNLPFGMVSEYEAFIAPRIFLSFIERLFTYRYWLDVVELLKVG